MIVLLIIFLTDVSLFKNMLRPILNVRANIFEMEVPFSHLIFIGFNSGLSTICGIIPI